MVNGQVFIKKLMLMSIGVLLMTALVTYAKADDQVIRTHSFYLEGVEELEFSNSVGSFEIVPVDGEEMRIVLDIEGERAGFFRRHVDVTGMDLEVKERGDTLFLSFEEKDANAEWLVEMPRSTSIKRTSIQMGVGEVRVEIDATDLNVELGVGEVNIEAPLASVGRVNLNVGVGDADIRGGEIIDSDSAFISRRIRAEGNGTYPLEVDLGVGDINVRLRGQ